MLFLTSSASAEPLVAGQRYQGPKSLEVGTFSIAFEIPAGWTGALPAGTEWFHIGKDEQIGRVFVWVSRASDADVRAAMVNGFTAAEAVTMTPTGEPRSEGAVLVGDFSASDGASTFSGYARARTSGGVAVAVVAVAPEEQFAVYKKLAVQVEKSVKFNVATKAGSPTAGTSAWATTLAGRRVSRYHNNSGATGSYSDKTQFDLCADGRFYKNFRASSVSGIGDGVSTSRDGGSWSVQGQQLTLKWSSGEVSQHQLEDRGGKLYVDGERWLLAGQAMCR